MKLHPRTVLFVQVFIVTFSLLVVLLGGTFRRFALVSSREIYAGLLVVSLLAIFSRRLTDWRTLSTPLDFGLLAFVLLTGIGVLLAPNPRRALEPWLFSIATPLPIAWATVYLLRRKWSLVLVFRGFLIAGFFIFALALSPLVDWLNDVASALRVGVDARPFRLWVMDNPAIFGMFLAIVTPVILAWCFAAGQKRERRLAVLWCILVVPLTIAHGTRSATIAMLAGLVGTVGLLILARPAFLLKRLREKRLQTLILGALVILLLAGGVGLLLYIQGLAPSHADPEDRINIYRIAIYAFREKPLAGWGPGSYIETQLRAFSYPPHPLVPHAHNLIFNLAAENGLIGVIGFGILALFAVIGIVRAWLALPAERLMLAGLIGGMTGFLCSGIFDYPPRQPALMIPAIIILMAIVARLPQHPSVQPLRVMAIILPNIGIVVTTLVLLVLYIQQAGVFQKFVTATQTNDSAQLAIVRAEADALKTIDPNDPLTALQAAYVWADAKTPEELQIAIERFERVVELDSRSAIHWVNLSALYRKAGDLDRAIEAARIGTRQAGDSAVAWLTLGQCFEAANHRQSAQDAWFRALQLAPHWRNANFWKEPNRPARQAALEQYRAWAAGQPPTYETRLQAGDFEAALKLAESPEEILTARGFIMLQRGDKTKAAEYFRQALRIETTGYVLAYAQLGLQRATGVPSRNILQLSGVRGPGTRRDLTYAQFMFWRLGLVNDWIDGTGQLDWTLNLEQLIP